MLARINQPHRPQDLSWRRARDESNCRPVRIRSTPRPSPASPQADHPTGAARGSCLRRLPVHQHSAGVLFRTAPCQLVVGAARVAVSAMTGGAAAGLWACAGEVVSFRHLLIAQFANTFAATTTPAGVGPTLSTRFLQKAAWARCAPPAAVAVQQAVQVITHVALLIFFSRRGGRLGGPVALRPQTHPALPDRRVGTRGHRGVPVRAQAAALVETACAAEDQRGRRRSGRIGTRA